MAGATHVDQMGVFVGFSRNGSANNNTAPANNSSAASTTASPNNNSAYLSDDELSELPSCAFAMRAVNGAATLGYSLSLAAGTYLGIEYAWGQKISLIITSIILILSSLTYRLSYMTKSTNV